MKPVEFEVTTDIAKVSETKIEANYDAVKAYITEAVAPYNSMVVSEETIPEAKKDRANIRKIVVRIDDYRKALKEEWIAPFKEFETKCKELKDICENAADNLDKQIKAFEATATADKIERLRGFFDRYAKREGMDKYLTFDSIYDDRWENKTYAVENAEKDIAWAISVVCQDIHTIQRMNSKYEAELISTYLYTRSMGEVVRKQAELEIYDKSPKKPVNTKIRGRRKTYTLTLKMTKEQANDLNAFIESNGIEIVKG